MEISIEEWKNERAWFFFWGLNIGLMLMLAFWLLAGVC